jgi:hypothetical protein
MTRVSLFCGVLLQAVDANALLTASLLIKADFKQPENDA